MISKISHYGTYKLFDLNYIRRLDNISLSVSISLEPIILRFNRYEAKIISKVKNYLIIKNTHNRLSQNSSGLYIWVINIGIFIFFKDIYYIKSILLKKINYSVSHVQKVRSKAAIFTSIEFGRVCF